jgi:iron(III) transport system substrate-binding protein
MSMKYWFLGAALALLATTATAQDRSRLQVASVFGAPELVEFKRLFEADNSDIEIVWERASTGVLTDRLLASQGTRPDAAWGLAVTSMLLLDRKGLLEPYAPKELADIRPNFRDAANPPAWVGMNAWIAAVCFNAAEAAKSGLPKPSSWFDLVDPRFKGKLSMPHPGSSGTGYLLVAGWIKVFGEARAWEFMDKLHDNIVTYEQSGVAPCRQVATGTLPVGISFDYAVAQVRKQGAPVEALVMKEGGGWDMDAAAIVRGTTRPTAARRLMDFAASRKANQHYASLLGQVAMKGVEGRNPDYPSSVTQSMVEADFLWAADNRARIIQEWVRRYGGKAAPKN